MGAVYRAARHEGSLGGKVFGLRGTLGQAYLKGSAPLVIVDAAVLDMKDALRPLGNGAVVSHENHRIAKFVKVLEQTEDFFC